VKHRWSVLVLLMLVLMLALVVFAPVALATDDQVGATAPQQLLWALMSIAVPFVTGLMVRKSYPKWLKALQPAWASARSTLLVAGLVMPGSLCWPASAWHR
jgi:predicted Na+-dependent transporter